MGVFSFTEKLVSKIMSSLGLSVMRLQCAPINAIVVEASMLPSHYCVPAIIEGVFLPRNSIPRIVIRSRQKWERISSTLKLFGFNLREICVCIVLSLYIDK